MWPAPPDALLDAFRRDAVGMLGIASVILVMFAVGELLRRRWGVEAEHTRKFAHLGGGVVVMSLPWVLSSHWSVAALCVAFFGVLAFGRVTGVLGSVHGVERPTSGAYLYPLAVYGCYRLSELGPTAGRADPLLFCGPMAVMAVADAGAALVGRRIGETRYRVMDGIRSVEGSFTFFALAFGMLLVALALDGRSGWPGVLLVALVGAVVTTCVEAISVRGVDNLFIPYAGSLVLERTLRLGLAEMGAWIEGMLAAFTVVTFGAWSVGLGAAGGIAAFLIGTLAWALGGPAWFVPLAVAGGLLALVRAPLGREVELEDVFPTLVVSLVVVLGFAHGGDPALYEPYLATVSANTAIGVWLASGHAHGPRRTTIRVVAAAVVPAFVAWSLDPGVAVPRVVLAGMIGMALFHAVRRTPMSGRRLLASVAAGGGSYLWEQLR
jgi:dolichol kinase